MYFALSEQIADPPQSPAPAPLSRRPAAPPRLRYMTFDGFCHNDAALTPPLREVVTRLFTHVKESLSTRTPVRAVRLVGHTDCTGGEKYNANLGDKRATSVKAELEQQLRAAGLWGRVFIIVETSPGEMQPVADNMTAEGRAANRRVEVFLDVTPPPPKPPVLTCPPYCGPQPPPGEGIGPGPGPGPKRKSFEQAVKEICAGKLPKWICKQLVDAVISGGCRALEEGFVRVGGTLNDGQKEQLRQRCREWASKPM
jgi:outer membrane protein OmpA-like peptidoglycan-associated protein